MGIDLQKANLWKRISAALFDGTLICVIALGLALLFAPLFGYNGYIDQLRDVYAKYENEYGVNFSISQEEYNELTVEEKELFSDATEALQNDEKTNNSYGMVINLTLLIVTFSILTAVLLFEFFVPLIFGNGQTLGKKIFGVAVMRIEGIKVSALTMFVRTVLGKFTIEIMVTLYVVLLVLMNALNVVGFAILLLLLIAQIICLAVTRVGALLHDVFAGTVVVDMASQQIFENKEELLEFIKKRHAEIAASADC